MPLMPYELIAPSFAFATIVLLGVGLFRAVNHGGLRARAHLLAFAPPPRATAGAAGPAFPLLKTARFSSISALDRLLQSKQRGLRLSLELARAALPLRVGEYVLVRSLLATLLVVLIWHSAGALPLCAVGGLAGYYLPGLYVRWRQVQRVRQFDDQLVDGLVLIANALKSGYSFLQGMEAIAREMPDPMGSEFREALREIRMGGAVDDALGGIHRRLRSADFELVVTAMVIQRQVGGNLTEILSNIAYTVRERHRILREVRILTTQERMSGYIVAALPLALVLLLSMLNPSYLAGMWHSDGGRGILAAGFVMEALGLLVIRKIVDIEV
ncbi:MAG: type II secretion system F family protein [Chloroflexota bacterium]